MVLAIDIDRIQVSTHDKEKQIQTTDTEVRMELHECLCI